MPAAPDTWSDRSRDLAALLARTGLGDRAAFATLYERSNAHLFAVVLRINKDRSQAEDVLQEVYVKVWRSAAGFDAAQSQPLTWLTSIARHQAIDSLRRAQTQPQTLSVHHHDSTTDDDSDTNMLDHTASDAPGPLDLLSQASDARALSACMQHLSAPQRQSLALAFYDGLSHAEVAQHMGLALGTVKSWVRRALLSLKTCLDASADLDASPHPHHKGP
jgi:RNA polymerase sigma factor (sigma-70 family)